MFLYISQLSGWPQLSIAALFLILVYYLLRISEKLDPALSSDQILSVNCFFLARNTPWLPVGSWVLNAIRGSHCISSDELAQTKHFLMPDNNLAVPRVIPMTSQYVKHMALQHSTCVECISNGYKSLSERLGLCCNVRYFSHMFPYRVKTSVSRSEQRCRASSLSLLSCRMVSCTETSNWRISFQIKISMLR